MITAAEARELVLGADKGFQSLCMDIRIAAGEGKRELFAGYLDQIVIDTLRGLGFCVDDPFDGCNYTVSW